MSTSAAQTNEVLSWKQEVNQRLAAHKSRRGIGVADSAESNGALHSSNPRAAQAAARVAARYAQAPSYSQVLADEARAAVRAAEAVSQAALKAQAVAESVLAELETAAYSMPMPEAVPEPEEAYEAAPSQATFFDPFLEVERPVARFESEAPEPALAIVWEPDMPVRQSEPARASRRAERFANAAEEWRSNTATYGEPETVEPAQPIHANLIEFPRELIATRKARPRIAEGPLVAEGGLPGQLSIFEVDPGTISIEPEPAHVIAETVAAGWSRLRLDAEPLREPMHETALAHVHPVHLAPVSLRLMAAIVDSVLIVAGFFGVALIAAANISSQPSMKAMEVAGVVTVLAISVIYQMFFFTLAESTPGMRYAGISLCTFDDERPNREQLRKRVWALMVSVLPMGLGLVWAIFDEDHLSWHDRISRTYQR